MTPSARLQAAIELLDEIIIAARDNGASADNIAKKFFKARRYAGSKDRRAVRELAYSAIRRFGNRPENGRSAMAGLSNEQNELIELFDGSSYGPSMLTDSENRSSGTLISEWLQNKFSKLIDDEEKQSLFDRAPLDIRFKGSEADFQKIAADWPEISKLALDNAYRLPAGTRVDDSEAHRTGKIEIQDLGSQAIAAACLPGNPNLVLDMCAGAGGKTMALAAQLPENTRIIASDTDRGRLSRIEPRVRRSRAQNIESILLSPGEEGAALDHLTGKCALVLVDAPCSGTGTWRRNPELRWRMTPKRLEQTVQLQERLFDLASGLVAPGGRLIYAVCSLLDVEGGEQTDKFLEKQPEWRNIEVDLPLGRSYRKGILLSPYHDGTDGFYFTCLEKM